MKKILAVNIDTITLNIISSLLTEHTSDFEVLTTERIGEVDEIIKKLTPSLVIIDLERPSPGDLQILGYLAKNFIKLPLMVMTAFETGEIESAIKAIGNLHYYEKPVDFKEIADNIFESIESGVGGEIHGVSLTSFLQMSEMEKTSCTLKIKTAEKTGYLYLSKGALIAAETETLSKEEAVYDILSWENPVIEIEDAKTNKKKEIQTPLMNLLMEGVRRKDEKKFGDKAGKKGTVKKAKKISIKSADIITADDTGPEDDKKDKPSEQPPDASTEYLEQLKASGKVTDASEVLKKKRLLAMAVKAAAVFALLITIFFLWRFFGDPWLAQRAFDQTMAEADRTLSTAAKVAALEAYLSTNPATTYAIQVENRIRSYQEDLKAQAFDRTVQQVSSLDIDEDFQSTAEEIYRAFLKAYPDSDYKDEIHQRIEELPAIIDDAAYRRLLEIPANQYSRRLAAYKQYLQQHPDGINTARVREMFSQLGEDFYQHINSVRRECEQNKEWQPCISLCRYFLENFDHHRRRGPISDLMQRLEDQAALAELTGQASEEGVYSASARQIYADYLAKNPRTTIRQHLEKEIEKIDRFQQQEAQWNSLQSYVTDSGNDIFDRAERMQRYIADGPPERFLQRARNIMARLDQEKKAIIEKTRTQAEQESQQRQKLAEIDSMQEQIRERLAAAGGRYQEKRRGTITDSRTGLTWCMLDSSVLTSQCINYGAARSYVAGLTTGGYNDWRLPTPTELLVIYNSTPPFPAGNASWYWTSEVFSAAWQERVNTVKRSDDGVWRKAETPLNKCGAVRAVRP